MAHKLLVFHGGVSFLKFVVILNDTILTNVNDLFIQNDINYNTAEEADPRLIRQLLETAIELKNITIRTVHSNVLVLSL